MNTQAQAQPSAPSLDEAVAAEIGALRLEIIKLRVTVHQTVAEAESKLNAKDREISVMRMELDRMLKEANSSGSGKVIDAIAVEKTATNGAISH